MAEIDTGCRIGEFENASLGDVVWAKRMDTLVDVPMPDGRERIQRMVDYVTMDKNFSFPLESNGSEIMPCDFINPKGLYGFIETVDFNVTSPLEYNEDAFPGNMAEAYAFFYLDHNSSDSISIVDAGEGIENNMSIDQVQVLVRDTNLRG